MKKFTPYVVLMVLAVFYFGAHAVITRHYAYTGHVEGAHSTSTNTSGDQPQVAGASTDESAASNTNDGQVPADERVANQKSSVLGVVSKPTSVAASTPMQNSNDTTGTTIPTTPVVTPPVNVAPVVAVTAPVANATVSGTMTVTATASDDKAVNQVSFAVDGVTAVTTPNAPYSFAWDTTKVTNGIHTISATATDNEGASTTSVAVAVTVNNVAATTGPNLITNSNLETANGTLPAGFTTNSFGNNVAVFTYPVAGHTGNGAQVSFASYTVDPNGSDAKFVTNAIAVTPGQSYQFSDYYMATTNTQVDYFDGTTGAWLGTLGAAPAAANWTQFNGSLTVPTGVTSIQIAHILSSQGTLTTDDYSLTSYTPAPFTKALVSVTFDDGWANQYANAFPVMQSLQLPATYYIISGALNTTDYMTSANVVSLYNAPTHNEIGAHTVHHCDLTGSGTINEDHTVCPVPMPDAQLQNELAEPQTVLNTLLGGNVVTDFAYPYGLYNATTVAAAQSLYTSQRTVVAGYNTKDTLNKNQLKMFEVDSNITTAQVQAWIDQAIKDKTWLILTYHEVADTPADPTDAQYTIKPADFTAQMQYLASKVADQSVLVQPVNQALVTVQL